MPLLVLAALLAQDPQPTDLRLSVSTTLVQVEVTVRDRKGKAVTDLRAGDFSLTEDGKARPISSVSYVEGRATPTVSTDAVGPIASRIQRSDVRRSVSILVDDLKMSVSSIHYTREALRSYVNTKLAPGDFVAILTTSGGTGPLQQFTTDKRRLLASIERLHARLSSALQDPIKALGATNDEDGLMLQLTSRRMAVGTMGALRYVVDGMRELPGRKSVILFSEGFPIARSQKIEEPGIPLSEVRRVTDHANEGSVAIYAVDPRGAIFSGLQAQDNSQGRETFEITEALQDRSGKIKDTQSGLRFLAQETGGSVSINNNDIVGGLTQMFEEQSSYYVLSFQASEADTKRIERDGKYRELSVKVSRPTLDVRYRKGYREANREAVARAVPDSPAARLLAALNSPFSGDGIPLRLTPIFSIGDKRQLAVGAQIHISGDSLSFSAPDATGLCTARVNVAARAEGEGPVPNASAIQTFTIRVPESLLSEARKNGFVYTLQTEVKKPGGYQIRVAMMDSVTGKIGSASRFLDVPDLSRSQLSISNITMREGDWRRGEPKEDLSPAVRMFERGHIFSYGVTVYNAPMDRQTGQPSLDIVPRLIRGEKVVWEGTKVPVALATGSDARSLLVGGVLTLGINSAPGEYILEVQTIDRAGKRPPVSQWIDFELR